MDELPEMTKLVRTFSRLDAEINQPSRSAGDPSTYYVLVGQLDTQGRDLRRAVRRLLVRRRAPIGAAVRAGTLVKEIGRFSSRWRDWPRREAADSPYDYSYRGRLIIDQAAQHLSIVKYELVMLADSLGLDVADTVRQIDPHQESVGAIVVYLDTTDRVLIDTAMSAVSELVDAIGYEGEGPVEVHYGSIFKRWFGRVKVGLTSRAVQERLTRLEEYAESYVDGRASEINSKEAEAFAAVVAALQDIPNACVRVHSLLVVKVTSTDGSMILSRSLSVREVKILDRYPEIQANPKKVLDMLGTALAVSQDEQPLPPGDGF